MLGSVEPHRFFLEVPPDTQLLYKIMSVENFLLSIKYSYLHFNRVDNYNDFPCADPHDGQQVPKDQERSERVKFEKAPNFSLANYYDRVRSRTYACCFSLDNSAFNWKNYGIDSEKGNVCVVFNFRKLRATINRFFQSGDAHIEFNGKHCDQIFDVNYGIVKYVEWENHQALTKRFPNPIEYTYLKDKKYTEERELRISLSNFYPGPITLNFPVSLQLSFDFKAAIADQIIQEIGHSPECDSDFLKTELQKFYIVPIKR